MREGSSQRSNFKEKTSILIGPCPHQCCSCMYGYHRQRMLFFVTITLRDHNFRQIMPVCFASLQNTFHKLFGTSEKLPFLFLVFLLLSFACFRHFYSLLEIRCVSWISPAFTYVCWRGLLLAHFQFWLHIF